MECPRRVESGRGVGSDIDKYKESDNKCDYCGSFDPDLLMKRIENGDIELGPTDKNYKVYLKNNGGDLFKQTYRDCPEDSKCTGPDDCTHWTTGTVDWGKFYFQHFSVEQRQKFVTLLNEKKLKIGYPGHFYSLPFFCESK